MQTYLVGGAVRDRLLGLPVGERDWVVVGATPAELEAQGYRRVGRSFPVYLHPQSHEEYALARTELKTGPGYHGFEVRSDPSVTLEEDLWRRDLTINAIAQDSSGALIDPVGGQAHLRERLLHHVSDAFREDPVRILRVARFAARFHDLGFRVADATRQLMREMVEAGEVAALVPERCWQETESALGESRPDIYFEVLHDCGALAVVFPEVAALFGVPQPEKWHPEIDTGRHILLALAASARLGHAREVRFAVLVHDLGKGTTPKSELPRHPGHEERGVALVRQLCDRLAIPNRFRDLGIAVTRHHGNCHRALELRPATILSLLESLDAFRKANHVEAFLDACEADARGRTGLEMVPYPQRELLHAVWQAALSVDSSVVAGQGLAGEALGAAIRHARLEACSSARTRFMADHAASRQPG
ncbi:MAG: multifunctional CCA addition/repair protein [Gammaproteobacteria bacterium]|nr:multifunctional CCA addition/repair protein [Gammaproteobacteria bacterium]